MKPINALTPEALHPAACAVLAVAAQPDSSIPPGSEAGAVLLSRIRQLFPALRGPCAGFLADTVLAYARDAHPDALTGDIGRDPDAARAVFRDAFAGALPSAPGRRETARLALAAARHARSLIPGQPLETAVRAATARCPAADGRSRRHAMLALRAALGDALGHNAPWLPRWDAMPLGATDDREALDKAIFALGKEVK